MSEQPAPVPAPSPTTTPTEKLPFPLHEGERVLRICRRHWIYLWPRTILYAVLALLPIIIGLILGADGPGDTGWNIFWLVIVLWVLFWGVRALLGWYQYHHDIWVITNQRLVDAYRKHPFSLRISTADLVNVQDISVDRSGIFKTFLDYGDILCQTAAEKQEFRMTGVPDPRDTQALVDRERDRERLRYRT